MIADERAQLQASQERERDMAERIRQLEMMQMQQGGKGQLPPGQYYAPPPPGTVQYAQPPVRMLSHLCRLQHHSNKSTQDKTKQNINMTSFYFSWTNNGC